jgi:FMN-dependent NADH-azoreductase
MQEPYLELVFGFIDITDIEVIHADNIVGRDDARTQAIANTQATLREAIAP